MKIKLPETFAAVPVLAQPGMMGGAWVWEVWEWVEVAGRHGHGRHGNGWNGNGWNGRHAGMEAAWVWVEWAWAGGGMGMGYGHGWRVAWVEWVMGGMGMGGGMFEIQPDKARKMKVPTVCLEHGKKDPNPRVKYKMIPLEEFNADPKVAEVCKALGNGKLQQNVAQAAAWHFTNGLSCKSWLRSRRLYRSTLGCQCGFRSSSCRTRCSFRTWLSNPFNRRLDPRADLTRPVLRQNLRNNPIQHRSKKGARSVPFFYSKEVARRTFERFSIR